MTSETTELLQRVKELESRIANLERQLEEKQHEINLLLRVISAHANLRDE